MKKKKPRVLRLLRYYMRVLWNDLTRPALKYNHGKHYYGGYNVEWNVE